MRILRIEVVIMLVVLALIVFTDNFQAAILGVILASLVFIKQIGDTAEDRSVSGTFEEFTHEKKCADDLRLTPEIHNKVYIKYFNSPIIKEFANEFIALSESRPEIELVILRMECVTYIDLSGVYAIKEASTVLRDNNIKLLVTGLQHQPKDMLEEVRMIPYTISEDTLFQDFQSAIKSLSTTPAPHHYSQKNEILIQA